MKRYIEFPLEDGTSLVVEVDDLDGNSAIRSSQRNGAAIEKAQQTLEKSLEKVRPAAQYIIQQIRKLHDAPNEIEVSFGLKLSAESGVILASAGLEANYLVKLTWNGPTSKTSQDLES